jgi:hypothetical protein
MNVESGDSDLRSIKTTTAVAANGINYGVTIDLKAGNLVLDGRLKCRFVVTTAWASAGNTAELRVFSDATTTPTTLVASSPTKLHSAMTIGAQLTIVLPKGALTHRYVRLGINNSALSATGAGIGDIMPIKN